MCACPRLSGNVNVEPCKSHALGAKMCSPACIEMAEDVSDARGRCAGIRWSVGKVRAQRMNE
uniref:Uncharacterized protein n=1 Tax=Anopheles funestus TaxID=62324 RepID=A0A182S309_ANOFN